MEQKLKTEADILFIQTFDIYYLGLMSISAFLKSNGFTTDLLISSNKNSILKYINDKDFPVIAFPVFKGGEEQIFNLTTAIKLAKPDAKILLGGVFATLFPDQAIVHQSIDFICVGEGELPTLELLKSLKEEKNYKNIKNLWIRDKDNIIKNPLRPLNNLDEMPFYDIELYKKYRHIFNNKAKVYKFSHGCPYSCTFCYNEIMKKIFKGCGKFIRAKSPQKVVDELKYWKSKSVLKKITFYDDNLLSNKKHFRELSKLLSESKQSLNLDISAWIRADDVNEETVKLLKDSGVTLVFFSIESGNQEYRNTVLNKKLKDEKIFSAAHLLKKNGIVTYAANMIALPNETVEMAIETIDICIKAKVDFALSTFFVPFQDAPLSKLSQEIYHLSDEFFNNLPLNTQKNPLLPIDNKKEIKNLQRLTTFIVRFSFFRPLLPYLIKLPNNPVFWFIYTIMRVYSMKKSLGFPFLSMFRFGISYIKGSS